MINHLFFWIYILAGSLGLSCIVISLLLYSKSRERLLLRYSVMLGLLGLLFLTEFLEFYSGVAQIGFFNPASELNIISYISLLFILSLYVPIFIIRLTGSGITKLKLLLILLPVIIYAAGIIIFTAGRRNPAVADLFDFGFFIIIGSWIFYLLKRRPDLAGSGNTAKIRLLVVLVLIFIPFLITDIVLPADRQYPFFGFISIPFLIFYMVWNILNLLFAYRLFFMPGDKIPLQNLDSFAALYRLTPREKEVSALIVSGESNKSIAYVLRISESTVKNHISGIFQKTGAQSRLELLVRLYNFDGA